MPFLDDNVQLEDAPGNQPVPDDRLPTAWQPPISKEGWSPQDLARGWRHAVDGKVEFAPEIAAQADQMGGPQFVTRPDGSRHLLVDVNGGGAADQDSIPASSSAGVHFKDIGQVLELQKQYPEQSHLTPQDFADWYAKTRSEPTTATIGTPVSPDPTAAPVGGNFLPDDAELSDSSEPSMLEQVGTGLGKGARDLLEGVGSTGDFLMSPAKLTEGDGANSVLYPNGRPTMTGAMSSLADVLGLPKNVTDRDKIAAAAYSAAVPALLTMGLGAPASVGAMASPAVGGMTGEMARQHGAGPVGQMAASLVGGVAGATAAMGVPAAAKRVAQSTIPNDILAAFQRQQVTPMAAQVGGFGSRMMTAGAKATLGGLPLAKAAERSIATAQAARNRIAQMMGRVADDTGAGQAAQKGANSLISSSSTKGGKLYDAIPIPAQTDASLSNTRTALAELNAGLKSNELLSEIIADKRLQAFQAALEGKSKQIPTGVLDAKGNPIIRQVRQGGRLSWEDLKAFRSYVGELAGRPTLQDSTSKEALQRLYAGLSADMKATAHGQGAKAVKAFERANSFWRARQARIDNTLSAILGKDLNKSPEAAFAQIQRWSREGGDSAQIARLMRSLPPEEAATVRATLFSRMGNARAEGHGENAIFSPNEFVRNWNAIDHRAKSVLFPGADYRRDLDDIARIADAMKASESFANTSRTALANHIGGNLLGSAALTYIFDPISAISTEGTGYAAGHLLASPRFARWIASAPKKPVGPATLAHINRLTAIATAEPTIANEVLHLQERLAKAFTAQPIAAQPEGDQQ